MKKLLIAAAATLSIAFVTPAFASTGIASWYSTRDSGSRTASGLPLRNGGLTAAMLNIPFGTRVRVTNLRNHRSIVVTITDRGPYVRGRIIDLTPRAARAIGMSGLARVKVEVAA